MLHPTTLEAARAVAHYRSNIWAWLQDCVYTEDPADPLTPIKQFPSAKPYFSPLTDLWVKSPLFAIAKSRRMVITWWAVSCHLWICMFNPSRQVFFASKKEDNSAELINRAKFIYDHIPAAKLPIKPEIRSTYLELEFPGLRSKITGVPEGSDQLRQFGASAIFCDEFGFWQDARKAWRAMKPTVEGGGRITAVSSAQIGSFFKEVVFGTMGEV